MGTFILFGSFTWFLIMLIALFVSYILADVFENGYSAFVCTLIFIGLNYFWGNLAWLSLFTPWNIGAYLFIGFLFSLIRTYFKGRELEGSDREFFDLQGHVFRWWFLFPFSAITWIVGDLFIQLWEFIYEFFEKMYEWLFNLGNPDKNKSKKEIL